MNNTKKLNQIYLIGFLCLLTSYAFVKSDEIIDFLSIGNEITFDEEKYDLVWSLNPSDGYYKQEYLREEDNLSKFNKMLTIDALETDLSAEQVASLKALELEAMKKDNPVVNYLKYDKKKTKETLVDFVISDKAFIYEWNLYRYQKQKIKKKEYIVLYAYTYRDSLNNNDDLKVFFNHIKENRFDMMDELGDLELPKIKPIN